MARPLFPSVIIRPDDSLQITPPAHVASFTHAICTVYSDIRDYASLAQKFLTTNIELIPARMKKALQLTITRNELDAFCTGLISKSHNVTSTHDTMVTLELFLSHFGSHAQGTDEYRAIETIINSFTRQTRQTLLEEKTSQLSDAIRLRDIPAIASIYNSLSRNGFYQILQDVARNLSNDEFTSAATWSLKWVKTSKLKAEQASGYPDALDFEKSGVDIVQYHAMDDMANFMIAR